MRSSTPDSWIVPDWPAPANVRALSTTRDGGVSRPPYDTLNLGGHVNDDPVAVAENRRRVVQLASLPAAPVWLQQVHGTVVVDAGAASRFPEADGSFSRQTGVVCAIMTADCLPVILCNETGTAIAAAHAGWRGLVDGVIEAALAAVDGDGPWMAWLGPAIGPQAFEVGEDVREAFLTADPDAADAFRPSPRGRWLADLYSLAQRRLRRAGVTQIYGGGFCTYSDPGRFFSYRRDGATGRMATMIWLAP